MDCGTTTVLHLANSGEFSLDMIGELLTHKSIVGIARNDAETPCLRIPLDSWPAIPGEAGFGR